MTIHRAQSPLAGKAVAIVTGYLAGNEIVIEDWWDRVIGKSWMDCDGNPAAMIYAARSGRGTPLDNEVLYGKIGWGGALVHVSWLEAGAASTETREAAE